MRKDLLRIVRQFFPDQELTDIHPYGAGHINDTYKLDLAGQEGYLLQRINRHVFREPEKVMHNIRGVYEHLSEKENQDCLLRPVADRSGNVFYKDTSGEYWRCFPFFSGTFSPDAPKDAPQARRAARVIGQFLNDLLSLSPESIEITIPHFHDPVKRMVHFREVLQLDPVNRKKEAEQEIASLQEHQSLFSRIATLNLPRRVVHNDAKISNVLFDRQSGRARCLIDWDTIMPGVILSDFGDLVRSCTPPVDENSTDLSRIEVDMDIFQALCEGFIPPLSSNLSPVEKQYLITGAPWITLEQALRFLSDYLEGDSYYKTAYPEQNLARTRNQLRLFQSMLDRQKEMEEIAAPFLYKDCG